MIVQKIICDRCSEDITLESIYRIAIEKADAEKLDDLGEYDDATIDCHFCAKCTEEIKSFIINELPFVAPMEEKKEIIVPEVAQEQKPSAGRKGKKQTRHEYTADTKNAIVEGFRNGKSVGALSKEFGVQYCTVYFWCHEADKARP